MKWLEIRINTTEEACDAITEMLTTIGAGGVCIEDPNEIKRQIDKDNSLDYADEEFLNSIGEKVLIKAYFPESKNKEEVILVINEKLKFISQFLDIGDGFIGCDLMDDEDWETAWKKYYKPFSISKSVVIKPTWEYYKEENNEIVVELDPGMAFGTGTHETTRMCAQALEEFIKKDDNVIDIGCGTGILSIIAAKLGAGHIDAVDIDEVAVKVADENSRLNGILEKISLFTGTLKDLTNVKKADVIVANIIADVIIDMAEIIPYYLKLDGFFITSGIIKARKDDVMNAYLGRGFECVDIKELGEWVAIVFKCQDSL